MNSTLKKQGTKEGASSAQAMGGSFSSLGIASPTQRKLAGCLSDVLDLLRDGCNDPELPAQTISMLLHVASCSEPKGILELGELTGMSRASASRVIQILGRGMRERSGLGYLETHEDPLNWSRKLVSLTPKGLRLVEAIETKLMGCFKRIAKE